jgi:hypothetical protein
MSHYLRCRANPLSDPVYQVDSPAIEDNNRHIMQPQFPQPYINMHFACYHVLHIARGVDDGRKNWYRKFEIAYFVLFCIAYK